MLHQSTARTTAPALAALSSNANHFVGLVMALSVGSTQMYGPAAYATCENVLSNVKYGVQNPGPSTHTVAKLIHK